MSIGNYGVLKARALETIEGTPASPHYQIHVAVGAEQAQTDFRIAVNVLSQLKPANLYYHVDDNFSYPTLPALLDLPDGFQALESQEGGLAIDYLRSPIVDQDHMQPVPFTDIATESQLNNLLAERVQQAIADPDARIYAFGDRWGPESDEKNLALERQYFGINPSDGVHNIHMNQGNDASHQREDGIWQDGALLIHLPSVQRWTAIFLRFQSQSTHTDDNGHALPGTLPVAAGHGHGHHHRH